MMMMMLSTTTHCARSTTSALVFALLLFSCFQERVSSFHVVNQRRFPSFALSQSTLQARQPVVRFMSNDDEELSMDAFKARRKQREEKKMEADNEESFDGYALRDVIQEKWGKCFDVDFNRVDNFGSRNLYLNVMPFHLGARTFRHETEMDYLCHLQAVVEILEKYDQIGVVLAQINETKKKPRAGTSPLIAVPLKLDLTKRQIAEITGN